MTEALMVLGTHRSGTSSVAGALCIVGGTAPKTLMQGDFRNARGYFESTPITDLNERLLAAAGSEWADWRAIDPAWNASPTAAEFRRRAAELFVGEYDGAPLAVLKDPRICRLLPFWLDVLRELDVAPRFALPFRSPFDAANSLHAAQAVPVRVGIAIWLRHVLDAEWHSRSLPRSFFSWRDFRTDWRAVVGRIERDANIRLPGLSDRNAAQVDRFLSSDLVHHDTDDGVWSGRSDVHAWAIQAYDALVELARNPQSNSAMAALDDLRARLDAAGGLFGPMLAEIELNLDDARARQKETGEDLAELVRRHAEALVAHAEAAGTAEAERADLARRFDHASAELEAHKAALAAAQGAAAEAEAGRRDALRERDALTARGIIDRGVAAGVAAALDDALVQAEQAHRDALRERDALDRANVALLAQAEAANAEIEAHKSAHARAEAEKEAARAEAAEAQRERDAVARRLDASHAERDALDRANVALMAQAEAANAEIEAHRSAHARAEAEK
ncbi:MAG: hypothetical protein KGI57_12265, partial [Hyphomicrobiales bacterium]|nr:hypothetical protein [Hyphomicrobiales bacterium]